MALRQISRGQVRTTAMQELKKQGGICPLCLKPIDVSIKGELVLDHDHETGRIRGALHRSCNSGEGKATNAIGSWVSKDHSYTEVIPALKRLVEYLEREPTNLIYYNHKTAEQKRLAKNAKERRRKAEVKARKRVNTTRGK